jgi:hypothetical protein
MKLVSRITQMFGNSTDHASKSFKHVPQVTREYTDSERLVLDKYAQAVMTGLFCRPDHNVSDTSVRNMMPTIIGIAQFCMLKRDTFTYQGAGLRIFDGYAQAALTGFVGRAGMRCDMIAAKSLVDGAFEVADMSMTERMVRYEGPNLFA